MFRVEPSQPTVTIPMAASRESMSGGCGCRRRSTLTRAEQSSRNRIFEPMKTDCSKHRHTSINLEGLTSFARRTALRLLRTEATGSRSVHRTRRFQAERSSSHRGPIVPHPIQHWSGLALKRIRRVALLRLRCSRAGRRRQAATPWQTGRVLPVSYTHLRAHETPEHLVCRLLLEKKKK